MTAENVEITCARESGIIVGSFDKELKILLEFPQFNSSRVWSGFEYYKLSSDGQIEDTCYTSDVADSDVRQSAKCFLKFPAICYIPPPEKFCPKGLTPFGRSCVHSFLIRSQEDEKTCEGYNGVYSNFENINTAINFMARILSKVHKTDVYCIQHNRFCPFGWATYKEKDWSLAKCIKLTEKERNFNSSSEICLGMNAVPFIPDEVESTKNLSTIIKRDLIYVGFKDQSRNGTFVDVYGKPIMAGYELLLLRNSGNLCGYLKNGNAYINYNCHSKHQMICQMDVCQDGFPNYDGTCYTNYLIASKYLAALNKCRAMGGYVNTNLRLNRTWNNLMDGKCSYIDNDVVRFKSCQSTSPFVCSPYEFKYKDYVVKFTYGMVEYLYIMDSMDFYEAITLCYEMKGQLVQDEEMYTKLYRLNILNAGIWISMKSDCAYGDLGVIKYNCSARYRPLCVYKENVCPTSYLYFQGECITLTKYVGSFSSMKYLCSRKFGKIASFNNTKTNLMVNLLQKFRYEEAWVLVNGKENISFNSSGSFVRIDASMPAFCSGKIVPTYS